ncbi:MAG: GNAT family N-acetyltransferase [Gemmataceae bacterium]
MYHVIQPTTLAQREQFRAAPGFVPINDTQLAEQTPDDLGMVCDDAENALGRCSLWWRQAPPHAEHRLGLIGHYENTGDATAARVLLQWACQQLTEQGCTLAVGPMDGNTWRRYRLITERGSEPPFFLEPDNPDAWPTHFQDAGFTPLAQYYSALNDNLEQHDPRIPELIEKLSIAGITIRPLNHARFTEELHHIHTVSIDSFRNNFLYTPLSQEEFLHMYQPLQRYIQPELVLLAERAGATVGFIFALPDLAQAQRGMAVDTIIIKTVAVASALSGSGLGSWLAHACHEAARALGYRRAIHALMHEGNRSRKISVHTARVIRRYTLYARPLGILP